MDCQVKETLTYTIHIVNHLVDLHLIIGQLSAGEQTLQHRVELFDQPNRSFEDYNVSRRATFLGAKLNNGRFLDWLRLLAPDCPVHKLKSFSVEMLLYLAKETVAQLVDLALLLRRDASVSPLDPYSRAHRTTLSFETFGTSQRQLEGSPPITPGEVREVLRRYYSTQLHPWGTFTCNLDTAVFNKILAC
ncbi:transcription initiation protein SPT3 homolog [Macrosteles quadrilineatus]|uniref:transcription initiation protein SPT3 homolog n=1 Tax=Macrosteles quadrilineatus TaxID=74068 RepID=UPI0023E0BB71|nr:transcription initiation protein SPT3 homolog [Macrosteles quadrilineatus]